MLVSMKLLITLLPGIVTCTAASDNIISLANRRLRKTADKDDVPTNSCKGSSSGNVIPWAMGGGPTTVTSFEELTAAIAKATNPSPPAQIRLCPGSITFDNDVDLSDKYFKIYCEKGGGEDDVCTFDMNGKSFVNNFIVGSDFSLEFEDVKIENGIAGQRDGGVPEVQPFAGGAFCLKGTDTVVNLPRQTRPRLSFRNCELFNNTAEVSGALGGAIYTNYTDIDVIDSIVRGNKASLGGAIFVEKGALNSISSNFTGNSAVVSGGAVFALDTDVSLTDSIMDGNSAVNGNGGALLDTDLDSPSLTTLNSIRTRFTRNFASREGGALKARKTASIMFDSCTFDGNEAGLRGGAMNIDERGTRNGALIKKSSFTSNIATSSGGAVYMTDGRTRFVRCIFFNNLSTGGQGGALYGFGPTGKQISIRKSTFTCNKGKVGGAMLMNKVLNLNDLRGQVNVSDSTFDGNMAIGGNGDGALYLTNMNVIISGSQFIGNAGGGDKPKGGAIQLSINCGRQCSNATFAMSGTAFQDNGFRNSTTSFPNDMDYFLGGRQERPDFDIMCGADARPGNSFCDANATLAPTISTNIPDSFCAGACTGPSCPFCAKLSQVSSCPSSPERRALSKAKASDMEIILSSLVDMDVPEDIDDIDISGMSESDLANLLAKCAETRIIKAIEEEHHYDAMMYEMMAGRS